MEKLKFALFGAGFWSRYQLAGWIETGLVECIAICDPIREKAEWQSVMGEDPLSADGAEGITDVKSLADGVDSQEVAYKDY